MLQGEHIEIGLREVTKQFESPLGIGQPFLKIELLP